MFSSTKEDVLQFLTKEFEAGASYGTLNSTRAALGLVLTKSITNDLIISQFFKGVFRLKPLKPRYSVTWDDRVLETLEKQWPLESLSLRQLSEKILMLLALCTAHKMQTFFLIKIENIKIFDARIEIKIPDFIKTSKPGRFQPLLLIPFFLMREKICARPRPY